ncbi:MAG: pilus assembly protein [Anaerolineae bacterium]|nr:pilus assembly protein [Anaerolineae bacterium]
MDTQAYTEKMERRRKGQTLAEFAITLPTLLLLMFGIIEFGRIFQAWVTLQNAARAAARYASTGQYDTTLYAMNTILNESSPSDPNGFIPCVDDGPEAVRTYTGVNNNESPSLDRRGTRDTVFPNGPSNPPVNIYTGGVESLFATWYDGKNCDPRDSDDQERRKDMARILSIMNEARRGAAGLSIEENMWNVPADKTRIKEDWISFPWFSGWQTIPTPPRSDQRHWFNVIVCSDRQFAYNQSTAEFQRDTGSGTVSTAPFRFIPYLGGADTLINGGTVVTPWSPSCLLNENPDPMPVGGFNNAGFPWMDAGAPEDTVFVIVTFNHPLITPIGLAPYIPIQARRSAIVETFRTAGNRKGAIFGPPVGANAPTLTYTPTDTPGPIPSDTPTPSLTPTGTNTPTRTPLPPFTCDLLDVGGLRLSGNQILATITNSNAQGTYISRIQLTWPTIPQISQMALTEMALNRVPNWQGRQPQNTGSASNTTDTDVQTGSPSFASTSIDIRTIETETSASWSASFSGPSSLDQFVTINRFGAIFYFYNPLTPATPCVITLDVPTPTPTRTPNSNATNTPTYTPDCASSLLRIRFVRFEEFGLVRLEVLNQRREISSLVSFNVNWVKRVNSLILRQVSVVAPPGQPNSVTVWDSGNVSQDANPPTNSRNEGTWLTNFTFDPGAPGAPSITAIYLDFDGAYRLDEVGVAPSDFNGSLFEITCGAPGGQGQGGGTVPTGNINLENFPTPTVSPTRGPTNTPRPTDTPRPTNTASRTPTQGPPQPTNTPRPPTATPPPQPTATNAPPPTLDTGGVGDGG